MIPITNGIWTFAKLAGIWTKQPESGPTYRNSLDSVKLVQNPYIIANQELKKMVFP